MPRERAAEICTKIMILEGKDFSIEENFLRELISDAEKCLNYLLNLISVNSLDDCLSVEELKNSLKNDPDIAVQAAVLEISEEEYQNYLVFMYLHT